MLEFQNMPGHLIRRLHQISVSVFTSQAAGAGFDVTPVQFAALSTIEAYPAIDQAGLARLIAYDRVTIGGVVDRLVQKGYSTGRSALAIGVHACFVLPSKAQLSCERLPRSCARCRATFCAGSTPQIGKAS